MLNTSLFFSSDFLSDVFFEIPVELVAGLEESGETIFATGLEGLAMMRGSSTFKDCNRFNASINLLMLVPYVGFTTP
jgi:hypothetical protein